jgi:hypothetical protein
MAVYFFRSVLWTRCRENIFLLIIIKYKIPGALSPGVKRSGREAEIQLELRKCEVVRSRHVYMKQLKTEGLRAGQPGLDSRQEQNVFLLQ